MDNEAEAKVLAKMLALLGSQQALTIVRDVELLDSGGQVNRDAWCVHIQAEGEEGSYLHTAPTLLIALERAHIIVGDIVFKGDTFQWFACDDHEPIAEWFQRHGLTR